MSRFLPREEHKETQFYHSGKAIYFITKKDIKGFLLDIILKKFCFRFQQINTGVWHLEKQPA